MAEPSKPPARTLDEAFVFHLRQLSKQKQQSGKKLPGPDTSSEEQKIKKNIEEKNRQTKRATPDPDEIGDSPPVTHSAETSRFAKRIKSPEPSPTPANQVTPSGLGSRTTPRNRQRGTDPAQDFDGVPRGQGQLWQPGLAGVSPVAPRAGAHQATSTATQQPRGAALSDQPHRRGTGPTKGGGGAGGLSHASAEQSLNQVNTLEKQPVTRPISQEQLIAEVKGIYAGLVMVESRCIEVDSAQTSLNDSPEAAKLSNDQWQALISLHRALLHEHHDFFLASQHPSAGVALRRLASKYAMPARMWRHGIHSFLELLRHRLPASSEYMLSFIYLAYSMMALLYETVPAFEETWIECLGDLSRYRMAIEDDDIHDRNVWTAVSRSWYSKASDKAPTTGRLHHHLAILARPDVIAQLFFYLKSLTVAIPFKSARDSILTLFDPVMTGTQSKLQPTNRAFIQIHGVFFTNKNEELLEPALNEFLSNLDLNIARSTRKWLEPGYQIAISNISAVLGHGAVTNALMKAIAASRPEDSSADTAMEVGADDDVEWPLRVQQALQFTESTDQIVMARLGDLNVLSYLHVRLFFMYSMSSLETAMIRLEDTFHWHLLCISLNSFIPEFEHPETYESGDFPKTPTKPLPEDWALRGLVWTDRIFPARHFEVDESEDDERMFETPSLGDYRRERVLWLGCRLAESRRWIIYDKTARRFSPVPKHEANIEIRPTTHKVPLDDEEILPDADAVGAVGGGISERLSADSPLESSQQTVPVTIIQPDRSGQGSS